MTRGVRERIVRFDVRQSLAGILSTSRDARERAPCVVLVNAGIVHRVGPNRLYVDIARALAAQGYTVLRFDLSGLGDSEGAAGGVSLSESAIADIKAAMEYLEQSRKATTFLIGGLCSGANYSMLASFADARVVGVLMIDPTVARTRYSTLVHLGRRLRHAATWGALLTLRHPVWRRSIGRLRNLAVVQAANAQSGRRALAQTGRDDSTGVRTLLEQAIARGVQLMLVFTGGVNHVYNYRNQLFDLLPGFDFRQQLRLEYMPETDHSVSDGASRAKLMQSIGEWMAESFDCPAAYKEEAS
jgi:pimeloyl-ACP methyl ester carboxylesterase